MNGRGATRRWITMTSALPWRLAATLIISTSLLSACSSSSDDETDTGEGTRSAQTDAAWFVEITDQLGITVAHDAGATGQLWSPEIMGPGTALLDVDHDGDLDIYVIHANDQLPTIGAGGSTPNQLFIHNDDGTFTDVTATCGADDRGYGMGVIAGDVNNDGRTDLYVANFGRDQLYLNRGDGTFANRTEQAGITVDGWSCSGAMLDYDRDGDLDIYVTQYVELEPDRECVDPSGQPDYCGPLSYPPLADVLLRNNGDGTFTDVSIECGISTTKAAGLGAVIDDFNDDGWIDVYVANDAYANNLWINQGDGTFEDPASRTGVALNLHGQAEAGMGVVSADFNRDGQTDLFVTHLNAESNTLYSKLNEQLLFNDATGPAGLAASSMMFTGFGVNAFDAELDGDLDLVIANGRVVRGTPRAECSLPEPWNRFGEPNLVYENAGDGTFTDRSGSEKAACGAAEITRGTAMGDLDDDGDLDLVVSNTQGPVRVYRNDADHAGPWLFLDVRLRDVDRTAIGAIVRVTRHDGTIHRIAVSPAVGYLSASDPRVHVGLGDNDGYASVDIQWPDGTRETFDGGSGRTSRTIRQGDGAPQS